MGLLLHLSRSRGASRARPCTLSAVGAGGDYQIVLDGSDGSVRLPPRRVAGNSRGDALVLIPGNPHGTIFQAADGSWSPAVEGLPEWVTSAVEPWRRGVSPGLAVPLSVPP